MTVDCCTVPSAPLSAAAEILTLYHRCATLFALLVSAPSHASLTCNLWSRRIGVGENPPASSTTQQPQCSSSSIFRAAFVSAHSCAPARSTAHAYGTVHQYQRYPAAHSSVVSKRRRYRTIETAATSAWLAVLTPILPQFTTINQVAICYIALHEHIASHAFSDVHAQLAQRTNAHAGIRRGMEFCRCSRSRQPHCRCAGECQHYSAKSWRTTRLQLHSLSISRLSQQHRLSLRTLVAPRTNTDDCSGQNRKELQVRGAVNFASR